MKDNKNQVIITTVPVTVKVFEVSGKKMTISVFNQIPSFLIHKYDPDNKDHIYLGWVNAKDGVYYVFYISGTLVKSKHRNHQVPYDIKQELSGAEGQFNLYRYTNIEAEKEKSSARLEKARAIYAEERAFAKKLNDIQDFLRDEQNQIYIAV